MYYLNRTCPSGHHHNGFMVLGALEHTHLRFYVAGIPHIEMSLIYVLP